MSYLYYVNPQTCPPKLRRAGIPVTVNLPGLDPPAKGLAPPGSTSAAPTATAKTTVAAAKRQGSVVPLALAAFAAVMLFK